MEEINERGYWLVTGGYYSHYLDEPLFNAIVKLIKGKVSSVIDVGCGGGEYTRRLIEVGIPCVGYDGNPLTPEITKGLCGVMDFSQPVDLGSYDLVLSLEVGEHIPAQYEQTFIDNLARMSNEYIILSWAIGGQPGMGHFNCRNNDYVINELDKRGYTFDVEGSSYLRDNSEFYWFKNTTMYFIKK